MFFPFLASAIEMRKSLLKRNYNLKKNLRETWTLETKCLFDQTMCFEFDGTL